MSRRIRFLTEGSEALVKGESVLWQGRPRVAGLARSLFRIRTVMVYFAVLAAWNLASAHADGLRGDGALVAAAWVLAPALAAAVVITAMAAVIAATTHYTITDRRVIMQFGVALPIALTLPLGRIAAADVKLTTHGGGDIPLALGDERLAYLLLWPHARPWRLKHAQPMLRAIPDAARVAGILAHALLQASPGGVIAGVATATPEAGGHRTHGGLVATA